MTKRTALFTLLATIGVLGIVPQSVIAADSDRIPLDVLYLGRGNEKPRSAAFANFLSERFRRCVNVDRDDFEPALLRGIDVVVLDWSQRESRGAKYDSPVGPLEDWQTPTVLLGSAGLLIAGPWQVIGGAG